jgi:hypothetical protein
VTRQNFLLILLGAASWLCYLAALALGDLRVNTISFVIVALAAFALYLAASALILKQPNHLTTQLPTTNHQLPIIIFFALLFRLTLLPTRPTLSDDMYRYVWDGRVQARGLSPYQYPPKADEVARLHKGDQTIWRYINRKEAVTVYPPGAQISYAAIWRIVGDSVTGFKAAFVITEFVGAVLLMRLLQHFGQSPERILIYLWSPLLIYEVAHAGHVDGLMLPFLIAAFWARANDRYWKLGLFLGAATMIKLFPILLLPALLPIPKISEVSRNFRSLKPSLRTLLAFTAIIIACYGVYIFREASPIGFLPNYFKENFNLGLAQLLFELADVLQWSKAALVNFVTFGGMAVIGLGCLIKPAASPRVALARCIWLIGWFTLFTQNLFSWYLLWLLPLIVIFIEPGQVFGFRLEAPTAWLVFSGTVLFSYLFFIQWRVVSWGQWAEFLPLYGLLLGAGWRRLKTHSAPLNPLSPIQDTSWIPYE